MHDSNNDSNGRSFWSSWFSRSSDKNGSQTREPVSKDSGNAKSHKRKTRKCPVQPFEDTLKILDEIL